MQATAGAKAQSRSPPVAVAERVRVHSRPFAVRSNSPPGNQARVVSSENRGSVSDVQPVFVRCSRGFNPLRCSRESGRSGAGYRRCKSPISFIPRRSCRTDSRSFASICGSFEQPPGTALSGYFTWKRTQVCSTHNGFLPVFGTNGLGPNPRRSRLRRMG